MTLSGGHYGTPWAQTFQYDGFGNLTGKVLNGTSTPIPVNAATNRLTDGYYDANGNMTSGAGATLTYDEANRVNTVMETSGGQETFAYAASNQGIYMMDQIPSVPVFRNGHSTSLPPIVPAHLYCWFTSPPGSQQ